MRTLNPTAKVIREKDTAAYKLFKWRFEVMIPSTYALSEYEIQQMGTPTTGDRKLDAELASEQAHTYRTIAELAKLHAEGCEIKLVNPTRDAPKIYDVTQQHLIDWATDLNQGFGVHVQTPETERRIKTALADIELLEAFATQLYPIAKRVMPAAYKTNTVAAKLAQLTNLRLRFAPATPTKAPTVATSAPSPFMDNLTTTGQDRIRKWSMGDHHG